ncbi:hypothetical protein Clacol_000737 [Clathrus columnatus]|uniref:Small ribosomal subunit protein uS5m n=1 Tax=Clathrus columnatus TaxID=1419009 RepID=A0AAV5A0J8_9AGAM|nr:hypothetical protein Clacol_000737 [Clathrus columnatus]
MLLIRRSLQCASRIPRYNTSRISTQRWNSTIPPKPNNENFSSNSLDSSEPASATDIPGAVSNEYSLNNIQEDPDEITLEGMDIVKLMEEIEDNEVTEPSPLASSEGSSPEYGLTMKDLVEREEGSFERGLTMRNLQDLTEEPGQFYALPDPVWDNTEQHTFESSKRARLRPDSRVLDTNWTPMFFDLEEIDKELDPEYEEPFNIDDIDEISGANSVDENEVRSPLHHLHIPFNELDRLHRYPLLQLRRTHQTGKGKINTRYALVVVGNGNGLVGIGEGKADELPQALDNAFAEAVRNMDYVDRFEDRTLWSEMELKFGSTRLYMRPRPVGFGLMCAPGIHQIFKAAGIKDASAKIWGSRNKVNVVKAATMMLHAGHQPLGLGNGIGGRARRLEKGTGMRNKTVVELERGRRIIDART